MTLPRAASHVVVSSPRDVPTTSCLLDGAEAFASIPLGPAECVALASDLLLAARVNYGRPLAAASDSGLAGQGPANGVRSPLVNPGDLPALETAGARQHEISDSLATVLEAIRQTTCLSRPSRTVV